MGEILDIGRLAFLEMVRDSIRTSGAAAVKGQLIRRALRLSEEIPEIEYKDMGEYENAVKTKENPITKIEGVSIREGNIFYLPSCPFAPTIKNYKQLLSKLPEEFSELAEEFNKPSRITAELKIGHGSGVSAFCPIHQSLRAAVGRRIKVGGKRVKIYQLGCKSADGKKAISDKFISEFGVDKEIISKILDKAMCVYGIKLEEV